MRKKDESILIYPEDVPENMTVAELFADGPIKIIISDTNHVQCKLGIAAPRELKIFREELLDRNQIRNWVSRNS
jgi:sRNA-binding carbon storage regulator CsrA